MAKDKYQNLIVRLLIILIILLPLSVLVSKKIFKPVKKKKLVLLEYDTEVVDDKFITERLEKQEEEKRKIEEEINKYRWPTDNGYYISTYYSRGHDGIDIAGISYGANVYAIYDGEVVTSSYTSTNGNYIIIRDTKGIYSLYAHLSKRNVNQGDKVSKGDIIGHIGSTGNSTGVHLHFSVWNGYPYNGGTSFNPYDLY